MTPLPLSVPWPTDPMMNPGEVRGGLPEREEAHVAGRRAGVGGGRAGRVELIQKPAAVVQVTCRGDQE